MFDSIGKLTSKINLNNISGCQVAPGSEKDILNRAKTFVICNASATNLRRNPDFSAVFGYASVNRWNNSICFIASQDAPEPLRTFVLRGFYIFT